MVQLKRMECRTIFVGVQLKFESFLLLLGFHYNDSKNFGSDVKISNRGLNLTSSFGLIEKKKRETRNEKTYRKKSFSLYVGRLADRHCAQSRTHFRELVSTLRGTYTICIQTIT